MTDRIRRLAGRLLCRVGWHRWEHHVAEFGHGHEWSRVCERCGHAIVEEFVWEDGPDDGLTDAEFWAEVERQTIAELTRRAGDA